jgi:hypothetical protein
MAELTQEAVREIVETPVTGLRGRTPREQVIEEKPSNNGREKEPVFLIDLSGSMNETAAPDSPLTKRQLIETAVPIAAGKLAGDDSQAAREAAEGKEGKGGVRSFGFNEPEEFYDWDEDEEEFGDERDFGDVHEGNVQEKLGGAPWGGRTHIMPAIRAAEKAFQAEFGSVPLRKRPTLEIVIWTDGKLNDEREFEEWLAQADETCVVGVAVVGFGGGHDAAVSSYKRLAAGNKYISVVALTGVSDPNEIALDVQLMAA